MALKIAGNMNYTLIGRLTNHLWWEMSSLLCMKKCIKMNSVFINKCKIKLLEENIRKYLYKSRRGNTFLSLTEDKKYEGKYRLHKIYIHKRWNKSTWYTNDKWKKLENRGK